MSSTSDRIGRRDVVHRSPDPTNIGAAIADRGEDSTEERPWWQVAPLDGRGVATVVGAYLVLVGAYVAIGLGIVHLWEPSRFGERDADVNRWFEDRRTDTMDRWADVGSALSDTLTMVLVAAIALPCMLLVFRRWHDWTLLVVALLLEVSTFATAATLVGRERPPVEQLDHAPTASFPSGHVAAAVVGYGALAMVLWWRVTSHAIRVAAVVVAAFAVAAVAISRIYRGMHYPTDVVWGALLGVLALLAVRIAIRATASRHGMTGPGLPGHPPPRGHGQ